MSNDPPTAEGESIPRSVQKDIDEYDTTEKLERTDTGYRLTIESTRGTGTRDQDKVKFEQRTEGLPEVESILGRVQDVQAAMEALRGFDPDGDDDA